MSDRGPRSCLWRRVKSSRPRSSRGTRTPHPFPGQPRGPLFEELLSPAAGPHPARRLGDEKAPCARGGKACGREPRRLRATPLPAGRSLWPASALPKSPSRRRGLPGPLSPGDRAGRAQAFSPESLGSSTGSVGTGGLGRPWGERTLPGGRPRPPRGGDPGWTAAPRPGVFPGRGKGSPAGGGS